MITEHGYSKDPNIVPQGIALTLGRGMIEEKCGPGRAGLLSFLRWFEYGVNQGGFFMKLKNRPTIEVDHVYIIVANRLYCRCYFGGYDNKFKGYMTPDDMQMSEVSWRGIHLGGPIEKPRFKRTLKGFQGFRYTTKLF
jgi:hypothetical protein